MSKVDLSDRLRSDLLSRHAQEAVTEQRKMFDNIDAKLDAMHQQGASDTDLPDSSMPERAKSNNAANGIGSLLLDRLNWEARLQGQPVDVLG